MSEVKHEGVIDAFREILKGNFVGKEEKERRLSICRKPCAYLEREFELNCTECFCLIDVKAALKNHDCPKNYWNNVSPHPEIRKP